MSSPKKTFRKGVCGIFLKDDGRILLGERLRDKDQWQLPQGGIEGDETPEEALHREIHEEVGIQGVKILKQTKKFIAYKWPKGLFPSKKYIGQEHIYFLLDGDKIKPRKLEATEEFARFGWFTVEEALEEIVEWKRSVYIQAFRELGLVKKRL